MRRAFAVFCAFAAVALVAPSGAFACHPEGLFSKLDQRVRMSDGVDLAVTLYTDQPSGCPHQVQRRPALMLFHGLGGTRAGPNQIAETYFARQGYVVLTFDARAHGESGGLFDLNGPREIADVAELYSWLSRRADVDPESVGALGPSYGGGAIWNAKVANIPFAAIVPMITWTDLYSALAPQNLTKSGVIFQLSRLVPPERYAPEPARLLADALANRNLPAIRLYTDGRSSRAGLALTPMRAFMIQGRRDFLFDVEQALAAFRLLGGPKRLYLGNLGHAPASNPAAEVEYYLTQARLWFDRFLKGTPNGIDTRPPIEIAADPWTGRTVSFARPPATRSLVFALPGRVTIGANGKAVRTTRALPRRQETFGTPLVRATVTPRGWTHVVAVLSALTPTGEVVVSEGGTRLSGSRTRTITIRLMNEVTALPARSRLRVTLAATSTAQDPGNLLYLVGVPQSARLRVGSIRLTLPVLRTPVSR